MQKSLPVIILLLLGLALVACNLPNSSTPTPVGADSLRTIAARTVDAMSTQLAGKPTLPIIASLTPALPTTSPVQQTTQPVATTAPCDQAVFIRDISIPDGTIFLPGTAFTKTWELKNTGSCSWNSNYSLVFGNEGDIMGGQVSKPLISSGAVAPGDIISVSAELIAPAGSGDYQGFWKLRNPNGELFGLGANKDKNFWVKIKVMNYNNRFEFVNNLCSAEWRNATGVIACPGKEGDAKGAMQRVENPKFSNGYEDDEPAIQLEPQLVTDGFIAGKFPPILIPPNSSFRTIIGCATKMDKCNAKISLTLQVGTDAEQSLGEWVQRAEDDFLKINIDLSAQAGKSGIFRFYVRANGAATQDRLLWLSPIMVPKS